MMFSAVHGIISLGLEERMVAVPPEKLRQQLAQFVDTHLVGLGIAIGNARDGELDETRYDCDHEDGALPLPLAGEGWVGVSPRWDCLNGESPHPALRADLRASFARLDPRKRER